MYLCFLHVVWLRILWCNARCLRLETAIVDLDKVGGGEVVNLNHPNKLFVPVTVTVTVTVTVLAWIYIDEYKLAWE